MTENASVCLSTYLDEDSAPSLDVFSFKTCAEPSADRLEAGDVIVQTLYLSVDPALRCRLNKDPGVEYLSPLKLGEAVLGLGGVGRVLHSKSTKLAEGDLVSGSLNWPWALRWVAAEDQINKIDQLPAGYGASIVMSCLGLIGLTSYLGITEKAQIQPGKNETIVVSGAAGACGSLAGQIAKLLGCKRAVGVCGSTEKCRVLRDELNFDATIDYKSENVIDKLRENCPDGIDIYFDNVGGAVSDAVIAQMNEGGRVVLCGQISQYNKKVPYPPPIPEQTTQILQQKNIARDRFLVLNYEFKFSEALAQLFQWLMEGKLKVKETVLEGLKNTPKAFVDMMNGGNIGKMIVKVSE